MTDIIQVLIKHVVQTKYHNLTPQAIDYAKTSIIDTIGAIVAGSTAEGCKAVVNLVKGWGGKEESTVWIYGGRVPAPLAGLALGPMARARDLGDVHEDGGGHLTEVILPAVFPMAERHGTITGRDLITAIALAQDVMVRIGKSRHPPSPLRAASNSIFGPTVAIAKLLGLDERTTTNAMGIAYAQLNADRQAYIEGALTVRVKHGFVAEAAIKSVLLAETGISGISNILQGKYGFYRAFEPHYDLRPLTYRLGETFEGAYTSTKPYPCCRYNHAAIEATLDLANEHSIEPADVAKIRVGIGPEAYPYVCEPKEVKYRPRNIVDCQFSLPYTVATALVKGHVFIDDFTQNAICRADVKEIMGKIRLRIERDVVKPDNSLIGGARVTISTKRGKEYSKLIYYAKGHPKNRLSMDEVISKFQACVPFSATNLPEENIKNLFTTINHLEDFDNVARLPELLVPSAIV